MKDAKLKSFLEKKLGKPNEEPNEIKQEARHRVLSDFKDAAKEHMADSMGKSLKKVTVMAKDKEDLKKGLETAEDLVEETEDTDLEDDVAEEAEEVLSEDLPDRDKAVAELEKKLAELQSALAALKA